MKKKMISWESLNILRVHRMLRLNPVTEHHLQGAMSEDSR